MKTRGVLLALLAGALAVAAAIWLRDAIEWVDVDVPTFPKDKVARDRFYVAKALIGALGATAVVRRSLDALPPPDATLVLGSSHWNMFPGRDDALRHWVEAGGRLVLAENATFGALAIPEWVPIRTVEAARPAAASGPAARPRLDYCHVVSEPDTVQPAFALARSYRVCASATSHVRELAATPQWALEDLGGKRMLRVPVGRGSATVSVLRGAFANNGIVADDGALVFAAALGLRSGDEVWFVDEEARTPFLRSLWAAAAPALLLALAAFALALWRGGPRFGPLGAEPRPARRSIGEQIRRTAAFIAAGDGQALHRASLHALEATAARAIPGYAALPSFDERAAAITRHADGDCAALAAAMRKPGRAHALAAAIATLERARRALLPEARAARSPNPLQAQVP
jgi:hypothetical protein